MLNVLHIFGRMNCGGAEMRTLELMRRLDRGRFRLHFCALSGLPGELDDDIRSAAEIRRFFTARFQPVSSAQQSSELVRSRIPSIVVSSSGMATGGRVLYHLAGTLPDKRNTVLFVGYQAAGTRGRQLVDGAREVKIRGQLVGVNARVERLDSMSAHADSLATLRAALHPRIRLEGAIWRPSQTHPDHP